VGAQEMYPWELWTNGETHVARSGEHYDGEPASFQVYLHTKARELGGQVETKIEGDGGYRVRVVFKFRFPRLQPVTCRWCKRVCKPDGRDPSLPEWHRTLLGPIGKGRWDTCPGTQHNPVQYLKEQTA
jgi:hypothetical protein